MKSDVTQVSHEASRIEAALANVEKTAQYVGFDAKKSANMRLVAEEMLASASGVLANIDGDMWVETDKKNFEIHLLIQGVFGLEDRDKLAAIAKSGKNKGPKGFFGKLSELISEAFLCTDTTMLPQNFDGMYVPDSSYMMWSMQQYNASNSTRTEKERDEYEGIEKKIMEGIADDIVVSARVGYVEIVAQKAL